MADIVTNTLQIGNDKLILRDADAQEKVTGLKSAVNDIENVLNIPINVTETKTVTQNKTWTTLTKVYLTANNEYDVTFSIPSQLTYVVFVRINDTTAASGQITVGNTSINFQFVPTTSGIYSFSANPYADSTVDLAVTVSITEDKESKVQELDRRVLIAEEDINDIYNVCSEKVDILPGLNVFDAKTIGIVADTLLTNAGAVITQNGYSTTGFIPVVPEKTYSNSQESGKYRKVCFYNSEKVNTSESDTVQNETIFTVPSDAVFARISVLTDNANKLAVNDSNEQLPYEPYNPIGGYLSNTNNANSTIDYGATLFTSKYNALGTSIDDLHATCYRRARGKNVTGVSFRCRAYASHTYFVAFDENGDILSSYTLSGGTTTDELHSVMFDSDVDSYSVMTLTTALSNSDLTEFVSGYGDEIINIEEKIDKTKETTYIALKKSIMDGWSELQFGMFIHWGVYSAWAGVYDGPNINGETIHVTGGTEWMWHNSKIPKANYVTKESDFTGANWNPDYICSLAKKLGMKYVVITARHHEGFSLMQSDHTEWDISTSGCTRDVLMELKKACDRHNLKFCLYVSSLLDWYDEGGYGQEVWNNNADPYTDAEHKAFVENQTKYMNELVETYDPYIIFYDGGTYIGSSVKYNLKRIFNENQTTNYPYVIVNNRGEGVYDYIDAENTYADYPNSTEKHERCNTICGWGYNTGHDSLSNYKPVKDIVWDMLETMGRGFNYLLNISPKGDGSIPAPTNTVFDSIAGILKKYTYFNGAKRLYNYAQPSWGRIINKGKSVYLFILPGNSSIYVDSILTDNISGVYVYGAESPSSDSNYDVLDADRLIIQNIPTSSDDYYSVVRIDFNDEPTCMDYNIITNAISGMSIVKLDYTEWTATTTGVVIDGYYQFGTDVSTSITKFKFVGSTGTHTISMDGSQTGTLSFAYTLYDEHMQKISEGATVNLTNGNIYYLEIEKTGSGTYTMNNLLIG